MAENKRDGKLRRFAKLGRRDQWLLLRAVIWLAVARIRLAVTPFARLAESLSSDREADSAVPCPELLQRIGFVVRAAANNVPWRSDCFPQTIAARQLLRGYGYKSTIHLGVQKAGDNEIAGHAWLTCGDTVVTGGEAFDHYVEVLRL